MKKYIFAGVAVAVLAISVLLISQQTSTPDKNSVVGLGDFGAVEADESVATVVPTVITGVYEYSEFAAPNQTWVYTLTRQQQGADISGGTLYIKGFQTQYGMRVKLETVGDTTNVIFRNDEPLVDGTKFIEGDALISFKITPAGNYAITWGKLKSNLVNPGKAEFKRKGDLGQFETTPMLYSGAGLNWKSQVLTYVDTIRYRASNTKDYGTYAPLAGTEWSASLSGLSEEQLSAVSAQNFEKFYETELPKGQWSYSAEVNGYTISASASDKPYSRLWGYVKTTGNDFQVIILRYTMSGKDVSGGGPISYAPPYTISYKVFLSDPKDIKDIVTADLIHNAELLRLSRDSQRLSDLGTLKGALSLYLTSVSSPALCADANIVYRSDKGTTAVDGTGWLPVNLTKTTGGSPIGQLVKDPTNTGSFIYSYACDPSNLTFELNANMEGARYSKGGKYDVESTDGGNNPSIYETGTAPGMKLITN